MPRSEKTRLSADKILTEKHAKAVLTEARREKSMSIKTGLHEKFVTDYFLFSVAYYTGLRVSEVCELCWRDVLEDALIVRAGKGKKKRSVIIGNKTKKLFDSFLAYQKKHWEMEGLPKDYIFLGQRGPLTRIGCHNRMKYWVHRLNLPDTLSFHSWRHGAATRWLDRGVPLSAVQRQLGHNNIATTSVYLHFTEEAKAKLVALS